MKEITIFTNKRLIAELSVDANMFFVLLLWHWGYFIAFWIFLGLGIIDMIVRSLDIAIFKKKNEIKD